MLRHRSLKRWPGRDPVAPATRSPQALEKIAPKTLLNGLPAHSFRTLPNELGTIVRDTCPRATPTRAKRSNQRDPIVARRLPRDFLNLILNFSAYSLTDWKLSLDRRDRLAPVNRFYTRKSKRARAPGRGSQAATIQNNYKFKIDTESYSNLCGLRGRSYNDLRARDG